MISKRTAVILIIAIIAIILFETNFSFDKMGQMKENLEHTVAQITVNLDGEVLDLKDAVLNYEYTDGEKPLTAKLSTLNNTGFEELKNNSVGFKPCAKGSNKLTFTIPNTLIPTYSRDIKVVFGCENNKADFNNYSLIVNLTSNDGNIQADVAQSLYYPDEKGNALSKKRDASDTLTAQDNTLECIITE